ncbi:MAG: hypothetical protein U1E61_07380 [Bradyrhizobium sp.]
MIGREAPSIFLESVTGLPAIELADALARLRRAELLRELALDPGVHAFSHPLVQEVCYRVLLRDRRRQHPAGVARIMRRHFTDRKAERAGFIAPGILRKPAKTMESAQAHIRAALWIGTHDSGPGLAQLEKVHQLLENQPYIRNPSATSALLAAYRF